MTKKFLRFFILFLFGFLLCINSSLCAPIKIDGIYFDNSDSMIYIKSEGELMPKVPIGSATFQSITKGYLENPNRVFFDIPNSILTTPSRTYTLKNSNIEEATISQFSINPSTVRIVLKYKKEKFNTPNPFEIYKNYNQAVIKYSNKLVENDIWHYIYNSPNDNFAPLNSELKEKEIKDPNDFEISINSPIKQNPTRNLKSDYKIESITKKENGVLIKGYGFFAFKPAIYLDNPNRMVVDIQNATINSELQNATFTMSTLLNEDNTLAQREILRVAQFDKNTVRLVIQGENAKDYGFVSAPDGQNLYIAKRSDIINTSLTQNLSELLNISASEEKGIKVLSFDFNNPVALNIFEQNKKLYFDMQNISNTNSEIFLEPAKNEYFSDIKVIRLAQDKMRIEFPLKENIEPSIRMAQNNARVKIYFDIAKPKITVPQEKQERNLFILKFKDKKISPMYKVVIDPGHGGSDTGATRFFVDEKNINLDVARLLERELKKQKIHTYMTRETDKYLTLEERVLFSEEINPNLYISIHVNASTKEEIYGIETHWFRDESYELAEIVHKHMTSKENLKKWNTIDRGLLKSKFYVINHTSAPAILVEIGFLSNEAERNKLLDKTRQEEIARAITDGIMEYLKKEQNKK